jgi:hypothetical protein
VLIGPPGVFVLDSKDLNGIVSVHHGVLKARWHEDPDDGYENRTLAPHARAAAADLRAALRAHGAAAAVQPVVVVWAEFLQRSILSKEVAWVHGKHLADVLEHRPAKLSQESTEGIVDALRSWVSSLEDQLQSEACSAA